MYNMLTPGNTETGHFQGHFLSQTTFTSRKIVSKQETIFEMTLNK